MRILFQLLCAAAVCAMLFCTEYTFDNPADPDGENFNAPPEFVTDDLPDSLLVNTAFEDTLAATDEADDDRLSQGQVGVTIELLDADDSGVFEFDNFEVRAPQ